MVYNEWDGTGCRMSGLERVVEGSGLEQAVEGVDWNRL